MNKMKRIGVFLPGRLESERLPNKLILPIGNTCLWEIACKKLNDLPNKYNKYVLIDKLNELYWIAKRFKNIKIIIRDPKTCVVDGPLTYIFKELKDLKDDYLMFLNPCLYNLSVKTIVNKLEEFDTCIETCATSVKEYKNWLWKPNGHSLIEPEYSTLSTKDIRAHYEAAHCFHIFNIKEFFETGKMLNKDLALLTIPKEETLDVDTKMDYKYARWKYENNNNI